MINMAVNFQKNMKAMKIVVWFFFTTVCEASPQDKLLSSYPDPIQEALAEYKECVVTDQAREDLLEIADFMTKIKSLPPREWKDRFCKAQQGSQYSYSVITVSIEEIPILLRQIDISSDGDALIPHNLVVGRHLTPKFRIESGKLENKPLDFEGWQSECVPFLFELGSPDEYKASLKSKRPVNDLVLFIATLCRVEQFHFKYFKYENRKWSEIPRTEFPKDRAVENLWDWMGGGIRYTKDTPKHIQDGLLESDLPFKRKKVIIKPDNWNFYTGLTARMWAHLESGVDFDNFEKHFSDEEAKAHAIGYVEKYGIQLTK